ncbi:MAG TPA: hypothetical protein VNJ53_10855 [Gaiellaceae bacterium]|nr:hypothetical protein [Gaiellaceae bacterium]
MSAAALTNMGPRGSSRLLAAVSALDALSAVEKRQPASSRLEAALGRELADRVLAVLSSEPRRS